ncbi:MAG TPA: tetratricopeptide repeat protein [Humisphaera sp.]|jgi:tetratricopeptide (TPR) repeat protein|nr:tetratricopeptide repeat protein [Humisphaera sp.]
MTSKRYLGLGGAVMLAVAAWTHPAFAQFPAQGQDGHANDANNRVGSGGYNGGGQRGPAVTGNQIVTRNVTGGREFRGPVGYSDPGSFTGPIGGGSVDRFVKNSSGVPDSSGAPNNLSNTVMAYYGDRRAVPPPAGSLPVGFNGGYVSSGSSLNNNANPSYNTGSSALSGLQSRTVDRDELELMSQLNPAAYGALSAQSNRELNSPSSPLWGGRLPGLNGDLGTTNIDLNAQNAASDRYRVADPALLQMQRELREAAGLQTPADTQKDNASSLNAPNSNGTPGNGQNNPALQSGVRNLDTPYQSPETTPLGQPMVSSLTPDPLNSSLKTYQSNRNYLTNPPPSLQSPQLDELQRRLKKYTDQPAPTDADEYRMFAAQRRRADMLAAQKAPFVAAPQPGGPGATMPPAKAREPVDMQPLFMHHLYDGIKAKGLHDLMEKAESQMKEGKFAAAIETYNRANQVAPNNSLTVLGRSIAELGAGFYAEADRDLRVTYRSAPELLWGQIDLKSMFPADRLTFLQTDLDRLTIDQPKESRPWFLKAFIAYNTGDPTATRKNLDEAEARSGKLDWTTRLLRQHWAPGASKAPTTRPASGLNK